jgi:hypothetical protein
VTTVLEDDLRKVRDILIAIAICIKATRKSVKYLKKSITPATTLDYFKHIGLIHKYTNYSSSMYAPDMRYFTWSGNGNYSNWVYFQHLYPKGYEDSLGQLNWSVFIIIRPTAINRELIFVAGERKADGYMFFDVMPYNPKDPAERVIYTINEVA